MMLKDLHPWMALNSSDVNKGLHFYGNIPLSYFTYNLSQSVGLLGDRQSLVLLPREAMKNAFIDALSLFAPRLNVISFSPFQTSPYHQQIPSRKESFLRMRFLYRALFPLENDIFLISTKDILQKTLSREKLLKSSLNISVGSTLPNNFFKQLESWGYIPTNQVEDFSQFSNRGGIIDVFSPYHYEPIRIELFGDEVDSLRFFNVESQLSSEAVDSVLITPCQEFILNNETDSDWISNWKEDCVKRGCEEDDIKGFLEPVIRGQYVNELEYLLSFKESVDSVVHKFSEPLLWIYDSIDCQGAMDSFLSNEKILYQSNSNGILCPPPDKIYENSDALSLIKKDSKICFDRVKLDDLDHYFISTNITLPMGLQKSIADNRDYSVFLKRLQELKESGVAVFIGVNTLSKSKRIESILKQGGFHPQTAANFYYEVSPLVEAQQSDKNLVHILDSDVGDSFLAEEDKILFLSESLFFGKRSKKTLAVKVKDRFSSIAFNEFNIGDRVVHIQHGVASFDGLKALDLNGIKTELIQLSFREGDKLYLPIYRIHQIQKYSAGGSLDKLGSKNWEKTKIRVKSALRDIASELLSIYSKRQRISKLPFSKPGKNYQEFEDRFPFEETEDQLTSIEATLNDMCSTKPMDRLICGDVGFGKTEIAMRAAFKAFENKRQVAVLVPTTILSFQHLESFKKRFKGCNANIAGLSRFTSNKDVKDILQNLKQGKIDIVIGTHRILSSDVNFYNLGLLIIDEEHRFGVTHKEKIKKIKVGVDTLALSATPIPRTLNMSLAGIRDLSLINSPPEDRLPIRTYLTKENLDLIKQAILSEVKRNGQVYFLHNRVQSIYSRQQELMELLPDIKIKVAHGQMKEDELEDIMVSFFKNEFHVLLSTTIIESGLDNPRANTMIIDNAHRFGLSQLYQIRGRVGRAKERAYCYLVIPPNIQLDKLAQDRLRIIQENTALGSGFKVANHDLELRGAGNILGESQSGNMNAVGFDLYFELLEQALAEARGEDPPAEDIEPEINLAITALIPDEYIQDIKSRLYYYKVMSEARVPDDMSKIEDNLSDIYGKPPEAVINLMGIMLIRSICKEMHIRDISSGKNNIILAFTSSTPIKVENLVDLSVSQSTKFKITPDQRLIIKVSSVDWSVILQELENLKSRLLL